MIICSGDSYTDENYKSKIVPDYDTSYPKWPSLLDFDEEVINVGECGADNQTIVRKAYKEAKKHDNVTKIILALSDWTRFNIFYRKFNPQLWTNPKLLEIKELQNEIAKQRGSLGDMADVIKSPIVRDWFFDQTLDNIHMLWDYCKNKNIELIIFQMLYPVGINKKYNKDFLDLLMLDKRFNEIKSVSLGWPFASEILGYNIMQMMRPEKHHIKPRIDGHPNAEAHRFIAKWFMGEYNNR